MQICRILGALLISQIAFAKEQPASNTAHEGRGHLKLIRIKYQDPFSKQSNQQQNQKKNSPLLPKEK